MDRGLTMCDTQSPISSSWEINIKNPSKTSANGATTEINCEKEEVII